MENTQKNIEENLQSSKKHSYNLHSPGVRTYKDSVFCRIFNEKKELLSLYNALNMSHYENPDDLEIITLDNALFLQMKNDVAFLINTTEMCLIEHSSTVCLNYPLRSLLYLAREYEVILEQRNENILKYGLVKIPTPACIVLYNGIEKRPEVEILPGKEKNRFRWKSGQIFTLYHDWYFHKIEEVVFDCNSGGVPHQHCMDIMIARNKSKES